MKRWIIGAFASVPAAVGLVASSCASDDAHPRPRAARAPLPSAREPARAGGDPNPSPPVSDALVSPARPEPQSGEDALGGDRASAASASGGNKIYSVGYITWIRKAPEIKEGAYLGYVRAGSSIRVKSLDRVAGAGCSKGFYQALPRGFICADRTVALAPEQPFGAAADLTRRVDGPMPYRYALSNGTPMYHRVPTAREQERNERFLGPPGSFTPLIKSLRSHEELAEQETIAPDVELPAFLKGGGGTKTAPFDLVARQFPKGSMMSFQHAFAAEGRTWLLSSDHTLVPADRVRPFRPSAFVGVDLTAGKMRLPLVWTRVKARPRFVKQGEAFVEEGSFAVRTALAWNGRREADHLAIVEADGKVAYIREADATIVEQASEIPLGVAPDQKWLQISITQGTLVAYEGMKPVYATLVSPGAGGVPVKGRDPVKDSTTPLGAYSLTFKDRASTMSPEEGEDRSFWIADVPHTQYFNPPFALHGAYWHERFGELVSAGCINLSPRDAEALFGWTDPQVPDEWQGATAAGAPENGKTTIVVIRR